jgi:hypothetical protein
MKKKIGLAIWAVLALSSPCSRAQDQGLGDMMFTAGTVKTAGSDEWAWLQWMATDGALLKNRPMDIYWKAGDETSANSFALKGTARQVTDPRTISLLLSRAAALGEDLVSLGVAVDSLYAGADPADSLSLAEKLAALISGSQNDSELYNNLVFMGRAHPAVSMAIGQGFACKIPTTGFSTFEVRDHNTSEVIGRLVLEARNPVVLPAPGPIARVPETSPMGNLNIRLRWDIPDDLKRLSLLQFGYNLYRVEKASALAWWGGTAKPTSTADLLAKVGGKPSAKKINRMPILVDAALASPTTWYAVDDNDGQLPGGTPFVDGEEYYYYVTALDLLARDGEVSDPFLTFPCDRMAPTVPHGIKTRTVSVFTNNVREQYVEISWDHNTNDVDTARYYVYRHTSLSNMQANAAYAVSNRISGAIIPDPTDTRIFYEDHTLSTNNYGRTYWYTVRAEDDARCAHNLSGNSAPAYGLLRDWEGPPPATGVVVRIQSMDLTTTYVNNYEPSTPDNLNIEMKCVRNIDGEEVEWVEFRWIQGSRDLDSITNAIPLGRFWYPEGSNTITKAYWFNPTLEIITVFCRIGSVSGQISDWAYATAYPHSTPKYPPDAVLFDGKCEFHFGAVLHYPWIHHWGFPGTPLVFPEIEIPATPGAESVRVYRRVDGGRRTLIHQGEMDEVLGAVIEDHSGGALNSSTICYYYQLFDENGNPSPMVKICCFKTEARASLPVPILDPIKSAGAATNAPSMTLKWFCTTPGVERFEVALGIADGTLPPTFGTSGYELTDGVTNQMNVVVDGVTNALDVGFYRTGRIGTVFGTAGSPQFELTGNIELDRDYIVMVRAIDTTGTQGEWSNAEKFRWSTVPVSGPTVPWPARELPLVQEDLFNNDLGAYYLLDATAWNPTCNNAAVGIKIGEIPPTIDDGSGGSEPVTVERVIDTSGGGDDKEMLAAYRFNIKYDIEEFLFDNADLERDPANPDTSILPCVLYRYQLTNELFRTVSGDVAQVSPLMETLAVGHKAAGNVTTLYDSFIFITRPPDTTDPYSIFLLDTQPVVHNATYQYLLVRFDETTHEIDRIIPAGTVTIP